jgi:hypothetical protein
MLTNAVLIPQFDAHYSLSSLLSPSLSQKINTNQKTKKINDYTGYPPQIQKTTHARQNRPNSLSGQPNLNIYLRIPAQHSTRPATRAR